MNTIPPLPVKNLSLSLAFVDIIPSLINSRPINRSMLPPPFVDVLSICALFPIESNK